MEDDLTEEDILYKKPEDKVSTNNPKVAKSCEKKITEVYIAKEKTLFIVIQPGDFLGRVAKDYMALTADDIAQNNRLPHPDKLKIGQIIVLSHRVHIVESGDSLKKISQKSEFAPVTWEEIANANSLSNPNHIRIGQTLVIPLAKSKHAELCKEIKYVKATDISVGDRINIVTKTEGFKNGESLSNTIKEDKNTITQTDENLTVTKDDNETTALTAINKEDKDDPTKGIAVTPTVEVKPKLDVLIHVVEKAEILGTIVKRYTDVTVEDIVEKNKLKDENSIYIGQKLIIPTEKMKELTTTQEVKDKLDKEPTKSTPIVATASAISLPQEGEVESEEVKLTVEPKIVKVYFGRRVKSKVFKPSGTKKYVFQGKNVISKENKNQQKIIDIIVGRMKKEDRETTSENVKKVLPYGTYEAGSDITVEMVEPVYTYEKLKSSLSLFSTVYLVAEVKDFPSDEKVKLEILEQDGVLAAKGANVEFIDKIEGEVTTIEVDVKSEGKNQYAVAKVVLSRIDKKAQKVWKDKIEKATNKKSHLKVKGTSVSGLCEAKKSKQKVELLGVFVLIKFVVDKGILLKGRPYEIILEDKTKIIGEVNEKNEVYGQALPEGKHKFRFTLPIGYDKPRRNTKERIVKNLNIKDETRDIVIIKNTLNKIIIKYTTYTFEPPKIDFNINLTGSDNKFMKSILGNPATKYGRNCDNTKLTKVYRKKVVLDHVGPFRVTGLEKAVESIKEVFLDLKDNYPKLHDGLTSAGMLCCRYVRGSKTSLSNHSWGTAIDLKINSQLDLQGDAKVQEGLLLIAKSFNKFSWFWGVHFSNEDGMHFEVSNEKLKEWYPKTIKTKKVVKNVKK